MPQNGAQGKKLLRLARSFYLVRSKSDCCREQPGAESVQVVGEFDQWQKRWDLYQKSKSELTLNDLYNHQHKLG